MIYFIQMTAREKFGAEIKEVIKIGFSDNFNKRLEAYCTHNTSFEVVKRLDGKIFSKGCENILHSYLRDKRYNGRTEVFTLDDELTRFIENTNSIGDIISLCSKIGKVKKSTKLHIRLYKPIILHNWNEISKVFNGNPEDIIISMLYYRVSDIKKHVKGLFGIDLQDVPEVDQKELEEFFKGYRKQGHRQYKLKYLCEYCRKVGDTSILRFIDEKKFDEYINILGIDTCKSLCYRITDLDKKLNVLKFDRTKIRERLYAEFIVGQSYVYSDIKSKLADIYKEIDYRANPKATDLNEYFDMKRCLINTAEKRINGFKILSQK